MTKFAQTDSTNRVVGWYDTDAIKYPNLPAGLVPVTDAEWDGRMANPSGWAVSNGVLVAYVAPVVVVQPAPPAPMLADLQAQLATLTAQIAALAATP